MFSSSKVISPDAEGYIPPAYMGKFYYIFYTTLLLIMHLFCNPKGEAYSRRFVRPSVRPSRYLVRQITLKLLLPF